MRGAGGDLGRASPRCVNIFVGEREVEEVVVDEVVEKGRFERAGWKRDGVTGRGGMSDGGDVEPEGGVGWGELAG